MAEPRQSDVLGALPRTRPERRSTKRPARTNGPASRAPAPAKPASGKRPASPGTRASGPRRKPSQSRPATAGSAKPASGKRPAKAGRLRQPPQPRGVPSQPRAPVPSGSPRPELLGTFVQAAAELTEIGLSVGAQVLRRAVARLPRP